MDTIIVRLMIRDFNPLKSKCNACFVRVNFDSDSRMKSRGFRPDYKFEWSFAYHKLKQYKRKTIKSRWYT